MGETGFLLEISVKEAGYPLEISVRNGLSVSETHGRNRTLSGISMGETGFLLVKSARKKQAIHQKYLWERLSVRDINHIMKREIGFLLWYLYEKQDFHNGSVG